MHITICMVPNTYVCEFMKPVNLVLKGQRGQLLSEIAFLTRFNRHTLALRLVRIYNYIIFVSHYIILQHFKAYGLVKENFLFILIFNTSAATFTLRSVNFLWF